MKILKEEELVPLRNALEEVQKFIREIENKDGAVLLSSI